MNIESVLALIVAIITLLSGVFVAFINKKYELSTKRVELKYKQLETSYNNSLEVFQSFVSHSTKIMDLLSVGEKPTSIDLQNFESSCLSCYLFLDENSRKDFQDFRIEVKIKFGYKDPRAKHLYGVTNELLKSVTLSSSLTIPADTLFTLFNKCLNTANSKLESISKQLQGV